MSDRVIWSSIFILTIVFAVFAVFFLWKQFGNFYIVKKLSGESKWKKRVFTLIPMLAIFAYLFFRTIPAIVATGHLVAIWLIVKLISLIVTKIRKKKSDNKYNIEGIITFVLTAIVLIYAWLQARTVVETHYEITSEKVDESFRIVMFTDSHIGCTFDGEKLAQYIKDMDKLEPDILVVVGDFVDDDSSKEDMLNATKAFSQIKPKYGTYFVFGNHDKGYYNKREYSGDDLKKELQKNNVVILEDQMVYIRDDIVLVGRQDRSMNSRLEMSELVNLVEPDKYMIVLDHQPNDQKAEFNANANLVLSGHTHGGQLIPFNFFGEWMSANDQTKGLRQKGDSTFIVSEGISDWAIPFKTGCKSEYVVIDINK